MRAGGVARAPLGPAGARVAHGEHGGARGVVALGAQCQRAEPRGRRRSLEPEQREVVRLIRVDARAHAMHAARRDAHLEPADTLGAGGRGEAPRDDRRLVRDPLGARQRPTAAPGKVSLLRLAVVPVLVVVLVVVVVDAVRAGQHEPPTDVHARAARHQMDGGADGGVDRRTPSNVHGPGAAPNVLRRCLLQCDLERQHRGNKRAPLGGALSERRHQLRSVLLPDGLPATLKA
mmetsp:Transcript_2494/g.6170  ORF Transcript_2494/g.6170 Transcript_2494/m.6170 type:complete len:233 (+) Transcript_2494:416-1114(+)